MSHLVQQLLCNTWPHASNHRSGRYNYGSSGREGEQITCPSDQPVPCFHQSCTVVTRDLSLIVKSYRLSDLMEQTSVDNVKSDLISSLKLPGLSYKTEWSSFIKKFYFLTTYNIYYVFFFQSILISASQKILETHELPISHQQARLTISPSLARLHFFLDNLVKEKKKKSFRHRLLRMPEGFLLTSIFYFLFFLGGGGGFSDLGIYYHF